MSELDPNLNSETPEQESPAEEKPSYTPATFEKRVTAWMGIGYVLIIMFAITFAIFTGGKTLAGAFPLFLVPVCIAAAVITVYRYCKGEAMYNGTLMTTVLIVVICIAVAGFGVAMAVPAVADAFRAARVR